ncbi:DUF6966 domain-containing protein [Undibacterium danionis]|uniref:DUF6966 domain-containing protein n=1 Tax=Undibacterium danionis TaxID=1812100 RepID=A0ABV6ID78_9BURK
MHSEVEKLANLIQEASTLLLTHGEKLWGDWLRIDAQRVRSLDFYGVEHMLSAFGGMGSINDLVLSSMNGHNIEEKDVANANEKFQNLLGRIYEIAKRLAKEEENAKKGT